MQLSQLPEVEGSLIALNPIDGSIQAQVGGYDFAKSKLDRTTQSVRQTGSNFKPFLYSTAIAEGMNINSSILDEEVKTWDSGTRTWWIPKNTPNRYDGIMTLREGLARSKNVVSIRLIRKVGVANVVEHVKKFGFEVPAFQQVEPMALGSYETTPLSLVTGYATFANGGYKVEPFYIKSIQKDGVEIYSYTPKIADPKAPNRVINAVPLIYDENIPEDPNLAPQILSHENAYLVADMLKSVIYGGQGIQGPYWGTGGRAFNITKRKDLYGKTGTTNNVHDAWFSGFNANLVATSWMGFDTDRDLGWSRASAEGGAYTALPIWAYFFKLAQEGVASSPIAKPEGIYTCTSPEGASDLCFTGGKIQSENEVKEKSQSEVDTSHITDDSIF